MRREVERRPALVACAGLILGLVAVYAPVTLLCWPALLILRSLRLKLTFAGFLLTGILLAPAIPRAGLSQQRPFSGSVWVSSVPRLYQDTAACEVESGSGRFLFYSPRSPAPHYGDVLRVTGTLDRLPEVSEDYWLKKGITAVLKVDSEAVEVQSQGPAIGALGSRWRDSFLEFTSASLEREVAHTVDALCFNVDTLLADEMKEDLRRSGTVHIISASGLHVLILASGLFLALSLVPIPRQVQLAILIAVLVVYAMATGLRPPIVRAVSMSLVLLLAYAWRREADMMSALAFTAILYMLWQPRAVFDIGFQLSFVVVSALALYLPFHHPSDSLSGRIKQSLATAVRGSLVATVAAAPLVAYYFGQISLVAVPANLLIAGVLPVVTLGALSAHILSFASPVLAAGIIGFVEPLCGWIQVVVRTFGDWSLAVVEVPAFSPFWIPFFYLAFVLTWRPHARPA